MLPSSSAAVNAPALQVLLIYNNAPLPELTFANAAFKPDFELDNGTSKFDFILDVADSPQGMIGHLKYRSDLFEKSSISNFILNWQAFIDQAVRNPNLPVAAVPLVFEPQPDPE